MFDMTQIIAFVGFKGVGKSTAAKYLEDRYGYVRHNFKDSLVAEIKEKFPDLLKEIQNVYSNPHQYQKPSIAELFTNKPPLMRALMQNYGTEVRRGDDPDYWVKEWYNKCMLEVPYVCDDVRFLNEANTIKDVRGIIIRLTRPDLPTGGDHKSETEQLQIEADYAIECEAGDFEKLYTALDEIVKSQ